MEVVLMVSGVICIALLGYLFYVLFWGEKL